MRRSASLALIFSALLGWHVSAQRLSASGPFSQISIASALHELGAARQEPQEARPVLLHREYPYYPPDAMRHKIQGTVVMECEVQTDGTVGSVRVVRSVDKTYGLDAEAVRVAKMWRFKPVIKDGKAVPGTVTIEMAFTLADQNPAKKKE